MKFMMNQKLGITWFLLGNIIKHLCVCCTHWELSGMIDSGVVDCDENRWVEEFEGGE